MAGRGFAPHAKAPQWKTGVTSSKTPIHTGGSHSALAPGRLSWLPGLLLLPRMLEQGCGKGWGVTGGGLWSLHQPEWAQSCPFQCSHPSQGCPCPVWELGMALGQCPGTGVMLLARVWREEAAVGPCVSVCPQSRRILLDRVALKCPE